MSQILLTGGLGFIGSHTCLSLINHGYNVLIIDSLVNSSKLNLNKIKNIVRKNNKSNLGNIIFFECDLRNNKLLDEIFYKQISLNNPIKSVIHFAGLKSVEESVKDPIKYWDLNINSTLSLLSSMKKFNCNNLVFSSSATIYKPLANEKLQEEAFQEPINPYGNTKISIEILLKDLFLSEKNKWRIINLRYFNPVGAHESGEIGEEPKGKATNLFPIIEKVVIGELDKLLVFGNDWPTDDGTCIRDYIHVMDLSDAHLAALKFLHENKSQYLSVNIGTGKGLSVLDIIETYSKINNISIPYQFVERRKGDAPYVVADNKLALKLLDWKPIRDIDQICIDSYRYIKNKSLEK